MEEAVYTSRGKLVRHGQVKDVLHVMAPTNTNEANNPQRESCKMMVRRSKEVSGNLTKECDGQKNHIFKQHMGLIKNSGCSLLQILKHDFEYPS